MIRWLRPRSVRVRLTLWYAGAMMVVLAVYAVAVLVVVRQSASQVLDERLHDDFDWAVAFQELADEIHVVGEHVHDRGGVRVALEDRIGLGA